MTERQRIDLLYKFDDPDHGGCEAMCRECGRVGLWADMFHLGAHGWFCGRCWYGRPLPAVEERRGACRHRWIKLPGRIPYDQWCTLCGALRRPDGEVLRPGKDR